MNPARALLVDDDPTILEVVGTLLSRHGHEVVGTGSGLRGAQCLRREHFDLAVVDLMLPDLNGLELARQAVANPDTVVVVLSGSTSVETALQAMRMGIYDYVPKPFRAEELEHTLLRAIEKSQLNQENKRLREQIQHKEPGPQMVGRSEAWQHLQTLLRRLAPSPSTVLITGPSGTGKELAARAIHQWSPRAQGPFVAIHCGAIPETLLEDELFGHVRGAYTDARTDRPGRFQQAEGGTLFLDEIGTMPLSLQVKLLRVIQEREFTPLGSARTVKADFRLLAATNEDLSALVAEKRFREDLFYRLNVIPVQLRPLREHRDDIPVLVAHFIRKFARELGLPLKQVEPAALQALEAYGWPGNVRELENAVERAMALGSDPERMLLQDLPAAIAGILPTAAYPRLPQHQGLGRFLEDLERHLVLEALQATGWNKSESARRLGMRRTTLLHRLKALGIPLNPMDEAESALAQESHDA
ncbi:sigma-54 dependent transcriptional regulator [Geothrix sp.]|jgi:DNA-binding NtrC family response regulator|uniref:sigma-54-dependent transcriptional regulator n=1 Tax=Geothrix sp. TaxID=1962974 RepID=UPI0025C632A2|nr:sigma-54 dependent transcriptional regulator [Geothrix sp.]